VNKAYMLDFRLVGILTAECHFVMVASKSK